MPEAIQLSNRGRVGRGNKWNRLHLVGLRTNCTSRSTRTLGRHLLQKRLEARARLSRCTTIPFEKTRRASLAWTLLVQSCLQNRLQSCFLRIYIPKVYLMSRLSPTFRKFKIRKEDLPCRAIFYNNVNMRRKRVIICNNVKMR